MLCISSIASIGVRTNSLQLGKDELGLLIILTEFSCIHIVRFPAKTRTQLYPYIQAQFASLTSFSKNAVSRMCSLIDLQLIGEQMFRIIFLPQMEAIAHYHLCAPRTRTNAEICHYFVVSLC